MIVVITKRSYLCQGVGATVGAGIYNASDFTKAQLDYLRSLGNLKEVKAPKPLPKPKKVKVKVETPPLPENLNPNKDTQEGVVLTDDNFN